MSPQARLFGGLAALSIGSATTQAIFASPWFAAAAFLLAFLFAVEAAMS